MPDRRGVQDRNGAWCPRIDNTAPNMSHDFPLDELELGRRAAVRVGNENREQWGAWIPGGLLWVNYAAVDVQLAQVDARTTWTPMPRRRPGPKSKFPQQRRPID